MNILKLQKPIESKPQQKSPLFSINSAQQKTEIKEVQETKVVDDISWVNTLRQEVLYEAQSFDNQLDQLEHQLIKKSNELQVIASKQMNQISQKNIVLVQEFVNYQKSLIQKLQGKHSNWDLLQNRLSEVELKFTQQIDRNQLPAKLAQISTMEFQIETLIKEIDELTKEKDSKKW